MTARTMVCQVTEVEDLSQDVFRIRLQGSAQSMAHAPGQYLELALDDDTWVPFSIANAQRGDGVLELHIQHWPGRANSTRLKEILQHAATLTLRLPGGECVLEPTDSQRPLLLIAAGTGFAQMKAILEAAFVANSERRIELWWAVRERRDLYLETLPREWAALYPNFHFHVAVEAEIEQDFDAAGVTAHQGRIDEALIRNFTDLSEFDVFVSGSPGMVYACVDALLPLGLKPERVYSDVFSYAPRQSALVGYNQDDSVTGGG